MNLIRVSSLALAVGLAVSAGGAAAQTLNEETDFGLPQFYGRGKNVSVMERERPDYQATGLHTGGFTIYPKIEIGADYDNNLFAVPGGASSAVYPFNGPKSDIGLVVSPSIVAQSNWGRHSLTALASLREEEFADYTSENRTAYTVQSYGRIDVHGDSFINLGVDGERDYEDRGSATTQTQAAAPVAYDSQGAFVRGVYGQDRLQAEVDSDFRNFHYEGVNQINPDGSQTPIDESLRDFTQGRVEGKATFALTPDEALDGQVVYTNGDYLYGNTFSPKRNFSEVKVLGGGTFDIASLARGEVDLGYVDRDYELAFYHGIKGLTAKARVEYFPTQLVTLTLTGQRLVEDAAFSTASGYFENLLTLTADYELKRNIIISASTGLEEDQFQGIKRTDDAEEFKLIGRYYVNRYVGLNATLDYTNRTSSGAVGDIGPIFDETRLMVSVIFQR